MNKIVAVSLLGWMALSACKTTDDGNQSEAKGLISERLTVEKEYKVSSSLKPTLDDMAQEQSVCFGKLTSSDNLDRAGIYLCTWAQGSDKLSTATSLAFVADTEDFTEGSGTYRELLKDGYPVGRMAIGKDGWVLDQVCTGENYVNRCDISFDASGFHFTWKTALNPTLWTYSLNTRGNLNFSMRPGSQADTYLGNISGHRFCMGRVQHNMGKNFALYPCGATLSAKNVILLYTKDGILRTNLHNNFTINGVTVGTAWVFTRGNQTMIQLHTLCENGACSLSYDGETAKMTLK